MKHTDQLALSTTTLARVRGFTLDLLFILNDGSFQLCDLTEITAKSTQYVARYLYNAKKYGLAEKEGYFWNLSVLGRDFLSHKDKVSKYSILYRKKIERKKKKDRKKIETSQPKKPQQVSISLFLAKANLDQREREVVEMLVDHYNETGSKFILVKDKYELAEKLQANPQDLGEALKNLVQDNLIYVYRLRREGLTKIGLKKAFVEMLKQGDRVE